MKFCMQLKQNHQLRQTRTLQNIKHVSEQNSLTYAITLALNDMIAETYSDLKRDTDNYVRQLITLKNRLSQKQNWHMLTDCFDTDILALVLTDNDFNVHDCE